jgi:hypothetical protein
MFTDRGRALSYAGACQYLGAGAGNTAVTGQGMPGVIREMI